MAEPDRRRRHLMVPGQTPPPPRGAMSLSTVQKWVLSSLAATTIAHLAVGLVVAAAYVEDTVSTVGLLVIAGAFGVIAVLAALLIHQVRLLTPWLLLGLLPAAVGGVLILR